VRIAPPISSSIQKTGDQVALTIRGDQATKNPDSPRDQELKFLAWFVDRAAQEVTAMKLVIVAVATMFALSSPAFAQSGSSDGLNGSTLGKSMPGVNNGVPYPNTNATDGTPRIGSSGAMPRMHRHHHRHRKH
jgi:hypothetical protein